MKKLFITLLLFCFYVAQGAHGAMIIQQFTSGAPTNFLECEFVESGASSVVLTGSGGTYCSVGSPTWTHEEENVYVQENSAGYVQLEGVTGQRVAIADMTDVADVVVTGVGRCGSAGDSTEWGVCVRGANGTDGVCAWQENINKLWLTGVDSGGGMQTISPSSTTDCTDCYIVLEIDGTAVTAKYYTTGDVLSATNTGTATTLTTGDVGLWLTGGAGRVYSLEAYEK